MDKNTEFIEKAKKVHGDKFDYSLVEYHNAKKKILITCKNNHTFEQTPNDHLNGHGCKFCSGWGIYKNNNQLFLEKIQEIHGNVYDFSKINYINHDTPIELFCKIHGTFFKTPKSLLIKKEGCQKCGYKNQTKKRTWDSFIFINKAKEIHGNKYDYSNVDYKKATLKIEIICKKHGSFYMSPKDHIHQKQGCPVCLESKGELKISSFLEKNNIKYIREKSFDNCINPLSNSKLYFDFYIPDRNIVIEYNGEQHYKPIKYFGGEKELNEKKFIW